MKMKFPLLTSLVLLTLQGCASHKIGPEATFVSEADRNNPPLEVSASFRDDLCGYSLGYLVVSIRNPSSEWRRMNATELSFPYNSDADFHVVGGRIAEACPQQSIISSPKAPDDHPISSK